MGFLSGGGDGGASRAFEAQREEMKKQEAVLAKQEAGVAEQKTELAKKAMATVRARRGGGLRALLSGERMDAELGLPQKTTLGSGV